MKRFLFLYVPLSSCIFSSELLLGSSVQISGGKVNGMNISRIRTSVTVRRKSKKKA